MFFGRFAVLRYDASHLLRMHGKALRAVDVTEEEENSFGQ